MIRTIIADMDGTLLRNGTYDERLEETVLRCTQRGITVGIASAKDKNRALPVYEALGMNGPLITDNGRTIYDYTKDEKQTLQNSDKGAALTHLHRQGVIDLERTLVIGDGLNDLPLFGVARGAAVANATKRLKEKASYVSRQRFSEGVIDIIDHYTTP